MDVWSYLRLMRFHKPAGTLLLWAPTAWALWIGSQGTPPVALLLYFFLGTVIMRAAGCVMNDIADRHIDCHVQRTRERPLTSGQLTLRQATGTLFVLLGLALFILLQLPYACFYYALVALLLTIVYPFCKRIIACPQLVLGLAFSMGIPMAFAALHRPVDLSMTLLFVINFAWIVAYDTEYAMVDRQDDLRIGVKSTAIYFAQWDTFIIAVLQAILHGLWLLLACISSLSLPFFLCWLAGGGLLLYQQWLISERKEAACLKAFSVNSGYGLILWVGLILDALLK
ncbi:4-hydroxybenzoate octaprenyltransferase [Legionella taurinensis]|uniref:4-hydroxybenzoate octaprenyltransferase n=2 Tax=Legionella taurinensis TaxID=70611 RepID=A0A3A5L9G8_9GAMM|nr:4-hydroxybenzoate octaprenyltransferase [Legionella taurinensis]RJT45557.1 4-hydroxybenzoate octaprenyltransferase [Legionella taurinensis]RJT66173.1 4-hydroxybenzoate octaprenyltransferase [Legionella taurinensis]STY26304.1 4-hydroxybenzoate-octaprenyltransferase [Legionella taurinensis]